MKVVHLGHCQPHLDHACHQVQHHEDLAACHRLAFHQADEVEEDQMSWDHQEEQDSS